MSAERAATLSLAALKPGRTFRGKRPANGGEFVNDRTILYVSLMGDIVQYDGPAIARGRHYPKVKAADFLKWAAEDITDKLPRDEYQTWSDYQRARAALAKAEAA